MKALNQAATEILEHLTEGMNLDASYRKISNSKTCMPVSVECIGQTAEGLLFSVAHYGEQNGDLMRDPDVEFLKSKTDGKFFPLTCRSDYTGTFHQAVIWEKGRAEKFHRGLQREITNFCNGWLPTIKKQQGL